MIFRIWLFCFLAKTKGIRIIMGNDNVLTSARKGWHGQLYQTLRRADAISMVHFSHPKPPIGCSKAYAQPSEAILGVNVVKKASIEALYS